VAISGGSGSLQITTTSLPQATVGVPYSTMLNASGGIPPYAFTVLQGPAWMITNSSGALSGTPTETGTFNLLIYVVGNGEGDATTNLTLEVTQPTALSLVSSLPSAVVGMPYMAAIVSGGRPTYMLEVTNGNLPNGFSFDSATGNISGTPAQAGNWTIPVRITDSSSPPATVTGEINLSATMLSELRITLSTEISVYTNSDINFELTAMGGVAPYTWSVVQGTFQEGISLDGSSGRLVGRVTHVGSSTVTFGVNDSMGNHVEKEIIVRATVFRSGGGGSGRGGASNRSGCACIAASTTTGSGGALEAFQLLIGAFALGFVFSLRRFSCKEGAWVRRSGRDARRSSPPSDLHRGPSKS
jgi:hypothetical protein